MRGRQLGPAGPAAYPESSYRSTGDNGGGRREGRGVDGCADTSVGETREGHDELLPVLWYAGGKGGCDESISSSRHDVWDWRSSRVGNGVPKTTGADRAGRRTVSPSGQLDRGDGEAHTRRTPTITIERGQGTGGAVGEQPGESTSTGVR